MKSQLHRINHILHTYLHDGNVSAMLKRTLIAVAVGIWIVFVMCVLLVWGLR